MGAPFARTTGRPQATPFFWLVPQSRSSAGGRVLAIGICCVGQISSGSLLSSPIGTALAIGLRRVVLDEGDPELLGWHNRGNVGLHAWDRNLCRTDFQPEYLNRWLLDRLGVEVRSAKGRVNVRWTETTAKAFQLMDVFLHELGHHHDRMTTRSRSQAARGERYAETYANRYAERIWDAYQAEFGW